MKTVIVYTSAHHGNTKKLVDAIAAEYGIETIDAMKNKEADLTGFDCIGIASGIAYSKYYPQMIEFMQENGLCIGASAGSGRTGNGTS